MARPPQDNLVARALARSRASLICIGVYSGAINMLTLSGSLFMLQVYDRVLPSGSTATLAALLAIVAFLATVQAILETIRARMLTRISRRLDEDLTGPAFRAAVAADAVGGERVDPARDLDRIRQFAATPGSAALFDLPWTPLYLFICFLFHAWLGWLTLAGALLVSTLAIWGELGSRTSAAAGARLAAHRQAVIDSARRNADVLGTMNFAATFGRRFDASTSRLLAVLQKGNDAATGVSAAVRALRMLLQSLVLALAAYLAIRQEISTGVIIAASILASRALAPIDVAVSQWRQFVAARQAAARLGQSLGATGAPEPGTRLPVPGSRLSVEGALAPPGVPAATVSGLCFSVEAGEGIGVIGPSGAGKTTLMRALTGAWPLSRGEITIDNAPIDQFGATARGAFIGYLPQAVELFDGTIAENIARFEPDRADEAVLRAARLAHVHDMILKFPQGYDSQVGEGGLRLSAGQRQRVGLARALYRDPFIVVLDEPYSNLDGDGDQALNLALAGVRARGGIVVMVAHRRSALAAVDKLLAISDGRQVAFGPKDQVLAEVAGLHKQQQQSAAAALVALPVQRRDTLKVVGHAG